MYSSQLAGCLVLVLLNGGKCVRYRNYTCGVDGSLATTVYEGEVDVAVYPWMGFLYYPFNKHLYTTGVVLVTRQMVIASAVEIDKMPKMDFRERARVVIGQKCNAGKIKVRDYTFHPDFVSQTISALVLIQLDLDDVKQELQPICPPPDHFIEPKIFAMVLSDSCIKPRVKIYRMQYLPTEACQQFYRRFGLNEESLWPKHTACARAMSGLKCIWRSGTLLTVKHDGRWRLLGFSVFGPGCGAPSRFLDYGKYQAWVRRSATTVGLPAVTRIADNHLVLRRASSNVQRFGPCDLEEMKDLLYTDRVQITTGAPQGLAKYNITIYANIEYSCVTFKADPELKIKVPFLLQSRFGSLNYTRPKIRLRRWCAGPAAMCFGFQFLEIRFYIEITFSSVVYFNVRAYGRQAKIIDPALALKQSQGEPLPLVPDYRSIILKVSRFKGIQTRYLWFYEKDLVLILGV